MVSIEDTFLYFMNRKHRIFGLILIIFLCLGSGVLTVSAAAPQPLHVPPVKKAPIKARAVAAKKRVVAKPAVKTAIATPTARTAPTLWFPFNEGANFPFLEDNATFRFTDVSGNIGSCGDDECPRSGVPGGEDRQGETVVEFNGAGQRIQVDNFPLRDYQSIGISAWIKLDEYNKEQYDDSTIVTKEWYACRAPWHTMLLAVNSNYLSQHPNLDPERKKLRFSVTLNGVIYAVLSSQDVPLKEWTHVVATWESKAYDKQNSGRLRLYMNGSQAGELAAPANLRITDAYYPYSKQTAHLNIGRRAICGGTNQTFKGLMDNFQIYDRALYQDEINEQFRARDPLVVPPPSILAGPPDNPWLWLPFQEVVGATAFRDASRYNRVANCVFGQCPTAGVAGGLARPGATVAQFNQLASNGIPVAGHGADRLTVSTTPLANFTKMSVEAWVYLDKYARSENAISAILVKEGDTCAPFSRPAVEFGVYNDFRPKTGKAPSLIRKPVFALRLNHAYNGFLGVVGARDVPLQKWTHLVGTWDGGTMRLYMDGAQVSKDVPATGAIIDSDATQLSIGQRPACLNQMNVPDSPLNGLLDDVVVYNRALTAMEVADRFAGK